MSKTIAVSDLASIESRVAGWLTGCERINQIFAEGKDTYRDFATEVYHIYYDEVNADQRHFSKPAVLGCFGESTLILADTGWKRIIDISKTDKLWDGEQWVKHDGVIYQGEQKVIEQYGVQATPSHPIHTGHGQWTSWSELHGENLNQAIKSGKGIPAILASMLLSGTKGNGTPLLNSANCSRRGTETSELSHVKCRQGKPRKRSSLSRETVVVSTHDVLNAGPKNRFTIWTDKGPMLAHNSCYGLGADGLMAYAEGYGVVMDKEESQRITDIYRSTYPEIPAAWRWLADAFMDVIEHRVLEAKGCGVRIFRDTNFLFMELPSGRRIAYYQPRVEMKVPPWERKRVEDAAALGELYVPKTIPNVTYMGMNQYTRKWERQSTHAGKILENACQAVARDILGYQMLEVENNRPNMDIILHVHDEMGALVEESTAAQDLAELEAIMSTTPPWAPGLILGAAGFISRRYRKD